MPFQWAFQSTPSARRATFSHFAPSFPHKYFNPRPPRGGRPRNKLAVASGYTLKATDEEELRKAGILLSDAIEY